MDSIGLVDPSILRVSLPLEEGDGGIIDKNNITDNVNKSVFVWKWWESPLGKVRDADGNIWAILPEPNHSCPHN